MHTYAHTYTHTHYSYQSLSLDPYLSLSLFLCFLELALTISSACCLSSDKYVHGSCTRIESPWDQPAKKHRWGHLDGQSRRYATLRSRWQLKKHRVRPFPSILVSRSSRRDGENCLYGSKPRERMRRERAGTPNCHALSAITSALKYFFFCEKKTL